MIKKIQKYKNKTNPLIFDLICAITTALLFSAFLYLQHFGFTLKLINTLFGILSLGMFLYIPKRAVLIAGFFIGILWFYWIGYSFKYNGVEYLTPFITLSFGLIYMLFFGVLALSKKIAIRAILLFMLSFFEPLDFNWMQIELIFVDSYIGVFKYQLFLVLLSLSLPYYIKKPYGYLSLLLLLTALDYNSASLKNAPLNIKLVQTNIIQEEKWLRKSELPIIQKNLQHIQKAINENYDLVVLPESCFPLYMNTRPVLQEILKKLSFKISIIAGALLKEKNNNYNVTYFFENGHIEIAKKLVLVPFGEYIPLPQFARKIINDTFFAGQADFCIAKKPTDFNIKGVKFRNAICYEATCQEIYEGNVDFVIATSNNAWFKPSIEPTLQKLLMKYYARKNHATIYHSANWQGTGIVN